MKEEATSKMIKEKDKIQKPNKDLNEIRDKIVVNSNELPVKQFVARNSLITDLLETQHIQIVYNLFLVALLGMFFHTAISDYVYYGRIRLGFYLIIKGFAKPHLWLSIWMGMFVSQFLIYGCFKWWATIRTQLQSKSIIVKLWDILWLSLYVLHIPIFMFVPTMGTVKFEIPPAASIAVLCELTRFLMKSYAFVRSNTPRVLKYTSNSKDYVICPTFRQYFYFLWIPTVIYRDSYPRCKTINWKYVILCSFEFMGCLLYMSFAFDKFVIPAFENYGRKHYSWQDLLVITVAQMTASFIATFAFFYGVLHAWMNAFAEICRFSDRLFYKDWWTSISFERYHRTWNVVVHDWLYLYIYKDFYEVIVPKNKMVAKYAVFFISAVFHDYILGFSFRYYTPVLFIQFFVIGVLILFLKVKYYTLGNVLLLYSIILGMSINFTFYSMEYYARVHCPVENPTFWSYFRPILFTCYK